MFIQADAASRRHLTRRLATMVTMFGRLFIAGILATGAQGVGAGPMGDACSAPEEIRASAITLVGEVHGTAEAPAWIGSVACGLARQHEVVVVLEIARSEQERIDAYMRSRGTPEDRSDLIAGPFWKGRDGRASEAMLALIDRLRGLAAQGAQVSVAAVDEWKGPGTRDAAMAAGIRELHADRAEARIIALLGNLHARSTKREPSKGPDDQPVGYLLRDLEPLTVIAEYREGQAWACAPECGPLALASPWGRSREAGFHPGESPRPGFQAAVNLGRVTLSPPVSRRGP
jgi:hypothetical protein